METQTAHNNNLNTPASNKDVLPRWRAGLAYVLLTALATTLAVAQATPNNFQQNGAAQDLGGGNLRFQYTWGSSTGNLNNLGDCQVGENVAYPGGNNPFVWNSPPYQANFRTPNPTVIWLRATTGTLQDTHTHAGFLQPYRADNFTATQDYRWRCTNVNNNNPTNFIAGIQIVRTVTNPRGNCWVYTITKSVATAQLMPLPGSGPCGNDQRNPQAIQPEPGGSGVSFALPSTTTTLHEPVMAQFSVFNPSGETVNFDLGKDFTSNFVVAVTGPDGKTTIRQLSAAGLGLDGRISLGAGESFSINLLLNQWNDFSAVGDYRIQITLNGSIASQSGQVLAAQPSQTLYLHIGARDAQRLGAISSALADAAINAPTIGERMAAAQTLSYVNDPVAIPELTRVLQQGTFVEQYAVEGLGRVGNAAAIASLWVATAHSDPDIRSLAVFTLDQLRRGTQPAVSVKD